MSLIDDIETVLTKYWEIGCFETFNGGSELNPVDLWANLRRRAHRFRFDPTVAFEQVHMEFAQSLIERQIFRLPFPTVIYEFACHGSYNDGEDVKPGRQLVMIADVSEVTDALHPAFEPLAASVSVRARQRSPLHASRNRTRELR